MVVTWFLILKSFYNMNTTTQLALITWARMTVAQLKASAPQDMGEGVMLTDAQFIEPQSVIQITVTLPDTIEVAPEEKEDFVEMQTGMICMGLCNDASSIEFLENGFTFKYVYFDTKGNLSHEIEITKDVFLRMLQEINEAMAEEE